jgi:hypothetical protein
MDVRVPASRPGDVGRMRLDVSLEYDNPAPTLMRAIYVVAQSEAHKPIDILRQAHAKAQ